MICESCGAIIDFTTVSELWLKVRIRALTDEIEAYMEPGKHVYIELAAVTEELARRKCKK